MAATPRTPRNRNAREAQADAFLRCRTYSHSWDEFFPIDLAAPWYGWRLSLRCTRCATERHDNYDFKGRVMSRRYLYPEGYRTTGEDRPTKEIFREELFTKLRKQLEAHAAVGGSEAEVVSITKATKRTRKTAAR
jgi:hypothetical protein